MLRIAALALALMLAAPAAAQFSDTAPAPSATAVGGPVGSPTYVIPPKQASGGAIDIGQAFSDAAAPYINAAVNALIAALIGWVCLRIQKRTGVEIDAGHREALVRALQNQAGSLIADGVVKIQGAKINVDNAKLASAANSVLKSIPDAAAHFGLTPDYVAERIVDMIPQTPAGAQMVAVAATPAAPAAARPSAA